MRYAYFFGRSEKASHGGDRKIRRPIQRELTSRVHPSRCSDILLKIVYVLGYQLL